MTAVKKERNMQVLLRCPVSEEQLTLLSCAEELRAAECLLDDVRGEVIIAIETDLEEGA